MANVDAGEVPLRTKNVLQRHPSGVECFEASWRRQRTRSHAHPEYQLTWTLAGVGRMTYRGGEARIPEGCMALFHPAEPHVIENLEQGRAWSFRVLHVPEKLLSGALRPLIQPAPFVAERALVRSFAAVFRAVLASSALDASLAELGQALAHRPGLEIARSQTSQVVRRCLNFLAEALDRPVSLAELSEAVACSSERVRRLFVEATGLPPHAWHLQRRIQHAKHLLAAGRSSAEVAVATGFSDQAHLTRHFSELVGVSPARYAGSSRKRARSG